MGKGGRAQSRVAREADLWTEFDKFKAEGKPIGPSSFAKHVGVHRTYLYKFPSLIAELSAYGRNTQPSISRRGGGISKVEAKRREIQAQVRREHTKWAKELPELQRKLREAEEQLRERDELIRSLGRQLDNLRRLYEHLLMLASEAGVSQNELGEIQKMISANPPDVRQ